MDIYKLRTTLKLVIKAFKKYNLKFGLMIGLGFLAGIFGSVGIGAVIPLFSFITKGQAVGDDFISQIISNIFTTINLPFTLPWLLTLMVLLFVLKSLTTFFATYMSAKFSAQYENDIREIMFTKVVNSSWLHLIEQKPGYIERVLMNDISASSSILQHVSNIILTSASLATYIIVAMNISMPITLTTLLVGIVIFFALKPIFYKTRKITEEMTKTDKRTTHHILEVLFGMKIVKSLNAEDKVTQLAKNDFKDLERRRVKSAIYHTVVGSLMEPVGITFVAALFLLNYNSSVFNIAAFAAIVYLVQKMFTFIQSIQGKINAVNGVVPYLQIMLDYWQEAANNQEVDGDINKFSFKNKIEFKNVSFAYNQETNILNNLNLEIKKTEMVGIIGPSGGGKTTLVDLMLRLFNPGSGEILIDNQNASKINLKNWRENIGYVAQDIFLINDTIENNIKFYDKSIDHGRVIEASKMANIYDFIETLPEGFQTKVGERGIKLSGGQRQRIALARTLIRKPEILILDEATSSLDSDSEAMIQNSIKDLRGKTTLVVIAHRLSTVQHADKLYAVDHGEIIESGTPSELLANKDSYFSKSYNIN
ncbi:MAG: hypothetical protein A3B86_02115 [Candidatus Yanofskybacteria bacterium RIFCSPHIGHO2_02_FULL_38_22b]|uniref:ABC transporter ATP-binding protein n=1 Tax=Candidatus Yanofskybacteria bacterium RIFCSPHIGHO2_02_FULL_38_22b TaxID=1802673 RepID=A0A1F8F3U6_9BACT|nr:MAG: hypothetical protein A2816_02990 [Candidatus Yanofskybacteria bacterium RIFCSPHIGHO2_01_FULL_39_44]OGN06916.1 MAG: hypothetical protein A3B86_02115 [Candidatus Yanofskybacteria bacterium RIFCSPHIGHO2_02_FULL_38_22b]OGN20680.1 MAG: hypothetical protein A2910_02700 [Candidatus Yanofskybacteria bacterium RIFCSPLOWO2_01_FULL_39_28]